MKEIARIFKTRIGWTILLLSLLPSIPLAFLMPTSSYISIFRDFGGANFAEAFLTGYGNIIIAMPVFLVATLLFLTLVYGSLIREQKTGVFKFSWRDINNNILPCMVSGVFYLIVYLIVRVITALFLSSATALAQAVNLPIVGVVVFLACLLLAFALFVPFVFLLPHSIYSGEKLKNNILFSARAGVKNYFSIYFSVCFPVLLLTCASILISRAGNGFLNLVTDTVLYALLFTWLTVYDIIAYTQYK
ncbi:MAG: hypothetical protein LBN25_04010 [Christensenellaceae bacterium]|jgi:hypothetical protein|nr:hypothetical protein [Christensenellaceae bacterium]